MRPQSKARHDAKIGIWTYSDQKIKSFTRATSIVVSAVLPASAMVALYFIKDTTIRLIVIFIYNLVFSFSLALMVKARPIEIFAAATASVYYPLLSKEVLLTVVLGKICCGPSDVDHKCALKGLDICLITDLHLELTKPLQNILNHFALYNWKM